MPRVGPAPIDDAAVQSQAEAVATVSLANRAIDKLGLATNPEFDSVEANSRAVDRFLSRLTVIARPGVAGGADRIGPARSGVRCARRQCGRRDPLAVPDVAAKAAAARPAGAWLAQKIEVLRAKVSDEDAKVEAFKD